MQIRTSRGFQNINLSGGSWVVSLKQKCFLKKTLIIYFQNLKKKCNFVTEMWMTGTSRRLTIFRAKTSDV